MTSSVSFLKASRRLSVHVAQEQPLAGEVVHQRLCFGVGQHARDLPFEHGRLFQFFLLGENQQLFIRDGTP
jgi:hypothetical protein